MKPIPSLKLALAISILFSVTAAAQPSLGTSALLEGPGAGSDSVVLAMANPTDAWMATANNAWLHVATTNQSGLGSTNVVFSYDANPGATRSGTLTIAGQTLTVTQAGSTYVAAPGSVTMLVSLGLNQPTGIAVDGVGNVYIADTNSIKKWTAASNTVTTLVSSGLSYPYGLAVDGAGNLFVADTGNNAIKKWTAASRTVSTLVSSGLSSPRGLTVDGAGNVYVADFGNSAIKKWTAADNSVTALVTGYQTWGVTVDGAGNVYFASGNAVRKWIAVSSSVVTVTTGPGPFYGVAVDGSGNVYFDISGPISPRVIRKWVASSNTSTTLASVYVSYGVAVDGAGNVYFSDYNNNAVKEVPRAFVDATARSEGPAPGTDVLPMVLPATANLLAPFAPTSDQPWLAVTGVANGVVSFAFDINTTGTDRSAHLTVLGQPISVAQSTGLIIITSQPASLAVCVGVPAIFSVSAVGDNLTYQWQVSQDGGNTFTNISATETNASCTNMAPTIVGSSTQYQVTITSGQASVTSAPAVLTVTADAVVNAGSNQTVCKGNCIQLQGLVGRGAKGGQWTSSGAGTFTPDATTLNAQYCPSAAEMQTGSVTLTLTTTGQPEGCFTATAQVVETLITPPTAVAGGGQTVCLGSCSLGLGGQIGGCATGGMWTTTGTGTFSPSASTLDASYCPSAADAASGAVTLTLTSTGPCSPCGPSTAQVVVTVNHPPIIVNPPGNLTVYPGTAATFSVGASGAALTYQWQESRDAGVTFTNISPTATNASYTTAPTTLADNGNRYRVIVNGGCLPPTISSPPAVLTVDVAAPTNRLPVISAQPQTRTSQPGVGVSFSVFSPNAASYQWRFNGVDIPGATNWTYQIANPQASNTGYYLAIAMNTYGWVPSQMAWLAVVSGPEAEVPFSNQTNNYFQGQAVDSNCSPLNNCSATVVAGPVLDQMQPVGASIPVVNGYYGSSSLTQTVPAVAAGQTVYYRVDIAPSPYRGTPQSTVLKFTAGGGSFPVPSCYGLKFPCWWVGEGLEPMLVFPSTPTNQVRGPGETFSLTNNYFCYLDFGYPQFQWRKDGKIIPGATNYVYNGLYNPFLTITNVQPADAGIYDLEVHGNNWFIAPKTVLSIQFSNTPVSIVITSQPASLVVCLGSPAVFSVAAGGGSLSYQWQVSRDGGITFTNVSTTETNSSYTNMAPTLADDGSQYQVVISSQGLSITSAPPAVLTVNPATTVNLGGSQTICAGNSTPGLGGSVGGAATGGVWSSSGTGTFVPDATTLNATYAPSAADISAASVTLTLTATGQLAPCPAAAQMNVMIQPPPAVVTPPSNLTVFAGSPAAFAVSATGPGLTFQWQVSRDGGVTFTNLSDLATNASYTSAATTLADNGNTYQVIVSGACLPSATSSPPAVLTVNPAPTAPPTLVGLTMLNDRTFQFGFTNYQPGASITVLSTTNPGLPLTNWTVASSATNVAPGLFLFSTDMTNATQSYYRVRSP
jgi:hypothetical protein